jgi:translation initiation factor IF-2
LAARNGVPICTSNVIYKLMDDVKQKLIDLLPVSVETAVTGEATVLQLFEIQIKAKETKQIAGCRVTNGIVEKTQFARVVRDGSVIHEGTQISSEETLTFSRRCITRSFRYNAPVEEGRNGSTQRVRMWSRLL